MVRGQHRAAGLLDITGSSRRHRFQTIDDEEIQGVIEWYDKTCIKVHRTNGPNVLILKHVIKYMYKQNEDQEPDEVDLE